MRILVTGGLGYIGSHTCVELLQRGMDLVIVDNLSNSKVAVLDRIETITGKRPTFFQQDVRDRDALNRIFRQHPIDCVIHFAGLKAVGESVEKPLSYYNNNLESTISLCQAMQENNVTRLVFSSSATVYTGDNPMPVAEDAKTGGCTNPYGWTKYMCEQILRDTAKANPDWSVMLLRYFNPVGAHASGLIGEDPRDIPNNLMPFICQTAAGRREKLSVFGDDYDTPDGTGVRDYIHVVDLARGHVDAIRYICGRTGVETVNLGTGNGYSVLEMVHTFEQVNHVAVPHVITGRRPGDLATCYANPTKGRCLLGWQAEHGLEDMCRDAWNWQKKNPTGYDQA